MVILVEPKDQKYDPRGVANYILDCCEMGGIAISNLKLQKIMFFVEGWHSATLGRQLIDADFEAWDYGPVISTIYHSFKSWGSEAIEGRANAINLKDGSTAPVKVNLPNDTVDLISFILARYGRLAPAKLVELSHVKDGPWDQVMRIEPTERKTSRISQDAIRDFFSKKIRSRTC